MKPISGMCIERCMTTHLLDSVHTVVVVKAGSKEESSSEYIVTSHFDRLVYAPPLSVKLSGVSPKLVPFLSRHDIARPSCDG